MLKPAFLFEKQLNDRYQIYLYHPSMKFLVEDVWLYQIPVESSDERYIQFVSIAPDGEILAFFSAEINRKLYHVDSLEVIIFDNNPVSSRDFYCFIKDLTGKFGFRKINFEAIVGSPGEKVYNKHAKHFKARVVGIKKQDVRLSDGKYYDIKMYEILP